MAQSFANNDVAAAIDQCINQYFEQSFRDAAEIDSSYLNLWRALHKLLKAGGKRLRPQLTLMAYSAFGGNDTTSMLPIAAAQELLHVSLLIHDDVIDRDYVRHNTLNIAGTYKDVYAQYLPSTEDAVHFAHGAAILAGDLMLSGAHELISSSTVATAHKVAARKLLSRSVFEVAGGELLDTELSFVPYTDGDALKVARYKTAGYSFVNPLLTGAEIAGASKADLKLLQAFGLSLGIAYQLVDDLLGTFGEASATGKSTTSDITEGKRTFMIEQTLKKLSDSDKHLFYKGFGKQNATAHDINEVKRLIIAAGAKDKTQQMIKSYANKAQAALDTLNLAQKQHKDFSDLIRSVTERTY